MAHRLLVLSPVCPVALVLSAKRPLRRSPQPFRLPLHHFLLTSQQDVSEIVRQQQHCKVNTIQICDRLHRGTYEELRAALPGIALVQVIHVTGDESLAEALAVAPHVNAILLDSGNQALAIKELGGTGRVHNWEISCEIRAQVNVPIFLAGGLNADNVAQAIKQVGPFGLDLCSGVRRYGKLNEELLERFFNQVALVVNETVGARLIVPT